MRDTLLTEVLESLGLEGPAVDTGLAVLYRTGLTRPGKQRIANAKVSRVEEAILRRYRPHLSQAGLPRRSPA